MAEVTLTPEEAAQRVLGLLDSDDKDDALALALALVDQCPDNMSVLYVAGQVCWHHGRREEAIEYQKRLIACDPANGQLHRNLVELLLRMDDQPEIAAASDAAQSAGIEDSSLINTGGLAHYKCGDLDRALAMFRRAVEINPGNGKAQRNISVVLMDRGDGEAAVAAYGESLRAWVPGHEEESKEDVMTRYDARAEIYDNNDLHRYFSRTMAAFIQDFAQLDHGHKVLDVGCGTGGVASHLKGTGARFWGVDISPEMLTVARDKGVYDDLSAGDMVECMTHHDGPFDAIVCCCVLYHLNELEHFMTQASRLLGAAGHLFISVDPAPDEYDIAIADQGEFAHSRAYLRRLAAAADLRELDIRIMKHRMMPGFWCAFQR